MKPKQFKTTDAKAARVFAQLGKAPNCAASFGVDERVEVAKLCNDDGSLNEGAREAFRLLLVEHYAENKATVEAVESPETEPAKKPAKK